jgi:RND family efflux transporter MFP subunit
MQPLALMRLPALRARARSYAPVALVLVSSAFACKPAQRASDAGASNAGAAADAQPVLLGAEDVAVATRVTLRTGPLISGTLEPEDKAVIRAEAAGSVIALDAQLGDAVKRGAVLARIEVGGLPDTYRSAQAAVRSAEHARELARQQLQRTERLVHSGAQPEKQLDDDRNAVSTADAQVEAARAQAATARKQLQDATVRAPLDGVVSEQPVHQGDVVAAGAPLFTVIDPSTLRLDAAVPSAALPELARGTAVEFEVRGHPGKRFRGEIARISPAADPATRQISIQVSIPNPASLVLAGLFAEGRIASKEKEALALPVDAVDQRGPHPLVTVIRGGRARRVEVELGMVDDVAQSVEIVRGLSAGERVVVGPVADLEEGTKVRFSGGAGAAAKLDAGRE